MSATSTTTPSPTDLHPTAQSPRVEGPALPPAIFNRILDEGYFNPDARSARAGDAGGTGAWYGSDLRAAIAEVTPATAFRRPRAGRHNIAEVALHHAYWVGQVTAKLTGGEPSAFPLVGKEDWFDLDDESKVSWAAIGALVEASQQRLSRMVGEIASGARVSPLSEAEQFDLVIGITGHAAYHAGQIQLIKRLI